MRILVTGGAGFIGSHYVRTLLNGGYAGYEDAAVTVYDKLTYAGNLDNLAPVASDPRYRFVHGDIVDEQLLLDVLPGHDAVINFAAETARRSFDRRSSRLRRHQRARSSDALRRVPTSRCPRVVHVGTDEVYGSIDEGSWTEESPLLPNSPYSAAKAGGRALGARVRTNVRPEHLDHPLLQQLRAVPVPREGRPAVRDELDGRQAVCRCTATASTCATGCSSMTTAAASSSCWSMAAGEAYNIGGGVELTNRELTQRLLDAMDADWDMVEYVEDRKGHDRRYSIDDSKMRSLGLHAAALLRPRSRRDGPVVPRQRGVVASAQGEGRHQPDDTLARHRSSWPAGIRT